MCPSWSSVARCCLPRTSNAYDFAQVVFQSKDILSQDETAAGLRRALLGDELLPQPTSTLVKQTIVYIQHNYAQHLARQQIAQAVGVSEDYLGRIFQQELGLSPIEYLNRYRIKEAKSLLSRTSASVTDIAAEVGFDDPAYFSRAFRKHVGLSPRAFREQPPSLGSRPTSSFSMMCARDRGGSLFSKFSPLSSKTAVVFLL